VAAKAAAKAPAVNAAETRKMGDKNK